ncbi:MAG: M23 family metallopeptidase [Nocardioidaceae bacterium]
MTTRPAPKRRAGKSRSGQSSSGKSRAGDHRSHASVNSAGRRFPALPTPAVIGAVALLVAGTGAIVVSSNTDANVPGSHYQALSADLTGVNTSRKAPNSVDVSRDFDRDLLAQQAEQQASQRDTALRELAKKTEKRAAKLKTNQWVLPVAGYHLTARFGQTSALWSTVHTGLDFAAASGTPIVAVTGGTVTGTGYAGAYGNRTIVTLDDGTEIWYCHQSSISVSTGDHVDPGQPIGYVGSTGNVTGPHLHLEVRPDPDTPVDPEPVLASHGVRP